MLTFLTHLINFNIIYNIPIISGISIEAIDKN